jgi:argininosuccinate lyase
VSEKTWGGRFSAATDNRVEAFTESIGFDRRLYRHDVVASQAHARMLAEVGLLTADEARQIVAALDDIAEQIDRGEFAFSVGLEDIHTHIERALIERLGDVGRKLHTGRSRNDQVVTDVKLWLRDAIDGLDARLMDLQRALVEAARRDRELVLPGYTHLQRAQPVLAAHYFLAYVEKCQRDRDRLADCRRRANVLPLGAALTSRATATSCSSSSSTCRSSPCTCPAGPRSGCCGVRPNSASSTCPTPSAPARASCRTRRTPTSWS